MKETKRMSAAQRRARQRKQRNRRIAMTVALVLVVALASIGGTIAWLTATTGSVVNTFTVGDVNITLKESGTTAGQDGNATKNYDFVPGDTLGKDPKVTVTANSEACYLFIHVVEDNNTVTVNNQSVKVINWGVRNDWTALTDHPGYYYRVVNASTEAQTFNILTANAMDADSQLINPDGEVTVSTAVTKEAMAQLTDGAKPTLTFTAAAVQKDNVADVAAAWTNLPDSFKSTT